MTIGYGQRGRAGLPREYFLNWGGWAAHPIEDRNVFLRLAKWRQDEISASFEDRPYVHQDQGKALEKELADRPSITDPQLLKVVQVIPDSIPLASIRVRQVEESMSDKISGRELSLDHFNAIMAALNTHLSADGLIQNCTPRGKGGHIKHAKPTDGVYAYIWRMARLFNGDDPCMPVTADWDLSDGIEKLTGLKISFCVTNEYGKGIMRSLEAYSDLLVLITGGNPLAGSLRWGRVMGWKEVAKMDKVASVLGISTEELTAVVSRLHAVGAGQ